MQNQTAQFEITLDQWLRLQLRVAALELSSVGLSCRLDLSQDPREQITCRVYFLDVEGKIGRPSPEELEEIYEGRIKFATDIIRRGFELAGFPQNFTCLTGVRYILYESLGMGGTVVKTVTRPFRWPQEPGTLTTG